MHEKIVQIVKCVGNSQAGILYSWDSHENTFTTVKAHPHLYANANKACGTKANANECQKVAYSAFAAQANEQAFHWSFVGCPNEYTSTLVWLRTYFSLKYRLQTDSIHLFTNIHHISEWRQMLFAYMTTLCVSCAFSHLRTDVDAALCELSEADFTVLENFELMFLRNT